MTYNFLLLFPLIVKMLNYLNKKNPSYLRRWSKKLLIMALIFLSLCMTLVIPVTNAIAISPKSELRGVWITNIDSDVLFEKKRLKNAINKLHELNFNTVYPVVWNWGYTLYPSKVAKKVIGQSLDPTPGLQKRDILKEIVTQVHRKKMTVIPWFEFGFMAPSDADLVKLHPEWILQRQDQSIIWNEGPHKRVWLNPLRPDVQKFILDLILEIVTKYDVDGIQFDDHFGFPSEFGYDNFTVALYKKEHNGNPPPTDVKNEDWIKWRADKITDYLGKISKEIKRKKRKCIISLSPNPWEFAYKSHLSDWKTWEKKGFIQELIVQIYRSDINRFIEELERPELVEASKHIPTSIGIIAGVKPRPVKISQIQQQVETVRQRKSLSGVSFFFYESLWKMTPETLEERQTVFKQMFNEKAIHPNIYKRWKPNS